MRNRLLDQPGLPGMVSKDLRQGVACRERLENALMHGLALRLEQAFIGRIAHQSVLEEIAGLGRRAAAKDQLGCGEPLQRLCDLRRRLGGDGGQQAVVELTADAGSRLRHLLDRLHAVEPSHQ
jgi:hypothetical protein